MKKPSASLMDRYFVREPKIGATGRVSDPDHAMFNPGRFSNFAIYDSK